MRICAFGRRRLARQGDWYSAHGRNGVSGQKPRRGAPYRRNIAGQRAHEGSGVEDRLWHGRCAARCEARSHRKGVGAVTNGPPWKNGRRARSASCRIRPRSRRACAGAFFGNDQADLRLADILLQARKRRILIRDSRVLPSSVKASIDCMLKGAVSRQAGFTTVARARSSTASSFSSPSLRDLPSPSTSSDTGSSIHSILPGSGGSSSQSTGLGVFSSRTAVELPARLVTCARLSPRRADSLARLCANCCFVAVAVEHLAVGLPVSWFDLRLQLRPSAPLRLPDFMAFDRAQPTDGDSRRSSVSRCATVRFQIIRAFPADQPLAHSRRLDFVLYIERGAEEVRGSRPAPPFAFWPPPSTPTSWPWCCSSTPQHICGPRCRTRRLQALRLVHACPGSAFALASRRIGDCRADHLPPSASVGTARLCRKRIRRIFHEFAGAHRSGRIWRLGPETPTGSRNFPIRGLQLSRPGGDTSRHAGACASPFTICQKPLQTRGSGDLAHLRGISGSCSLVEGHGRKLDYLRHFRSVTRF